MQAKNLCFYLSDHGFGHIARNIPLIAESVRRTNGFVYVVCGKRHLEFAKANLLEILTPEQSSRIRYRAEHTDIGLILQQGTLLVDTAALTDACAQYLAELPERAKREAEWLRQQEVAAALCDMPLWSIPACEQLVCRCSMWEISHGQSCTGSFYRNISGKPMPQSIGRYSTECFMRCITRKC